MHIQTYWIFILFIHHHVFLDLNTKDRSLFLSSVSVFNIRKEIKFWNTLLRYHLFTNKNELHLNCIYESSAYVVINYMISGYFLSIGVSVSLILLSRHLYRDGQAKILVNLFVSDSRRAFVLFMRRSTKFKLSYTNTCMISLWNIYRTSLSQSLQVNMFGRKDVANRANRRRLKARDGIIQIDLDFHSSVCSENYKSRLGQFPICRTELVCVLVDLDWVVKSF